MCVCIRVSESIRSEYIFEKRDTRARKRFSPFPLFYHIARAFLIPFSRQRPDVRVRLIRARGPTSASPLLLRCGPRSPFASSYLRCPSVLDRPATPANSCRHPVPFDPLPRERPTRDRYLRGKMARRLSHSLPCDFSVAARIPVHIFGCSGFFQTAFYIESCNRR